MFWMSCSNTPGNDTWSQHLLNYSTKEIYNTFLVPMTYLSIPQLHKNRATIKYRLYFSSGVEEHILMVQKYVETNNVKIVVYVRNILRLFCIIHCPNVHFLSIITSPRTEPAIFIIFSVLLTFFYRIFQFENNFFHKH